MSDSYTAILQLVASILRDDLSNQERNVLDFIIQRTLRYDKNTESIPQSHFLNGVFDAHGKPICAGVTKNRNQLKKALKSLEDRGYIHVSKVGDCYRYMVLQQDLIDIGAKVMSKLKLSKREKARFKESEGVQIDTSEGSKRIHTGGSKRIHISNRSKVTEVKVMDSPCRDEAIVDTIEKAREDNVAALRKKAEAVRDRKTKVNTLALWKLTVREHCPEAPIVHDLTPRNWKTLQANTKHMRSYDYYDFIVWCVENWSTASRSSDLKWIEGISDIPDLNLFANATRHFIKAYGRKPAKERVLGARQRAQERDSDQSNAKVAGQASDAQKRLEKAEREAAHYKQLLLERNREARQPRKRDLQTIADAPIPDELPEFAADE